MDYYELTNEEHNLLNDDKRIGAIKAVRKRLGVNLKEAAFVVKVEQLKRAEVRITDLESRLARAHDRIDVADREIMDLDNRLTNGGDLLDSYLDETMANSNLLDSIRVLLELGRTDHALTLIPKKA